MAYCTRDDMIARFGLEEIRRLLVRNLAGDEQSTYGGGGTYDGSGNADGLSPAAEARLDSIIADATAEVDGYLAGRYSLPVTPLPSVLVRLTCDIARYFLYDDAAHEQVEKRYDNAIAFLKAVAKGQVALGLDDQGSKVVPTDGAHIESAGNVFARGFGGRGRRL